MKKVIVCIVSIMAAILITAAAHAGSAVISELKAAGGSVEVRKVGQKDWARAALLMALDAGDAVRAAGSGYAVVVSASGGKAVKVTAANSPYELKSPESGSSRPEKAQVVMNKLMDFMSGKKKETLSTPLAVRSLKRAPGLVSPKDSKVLTSQPLFEWIGTPRVPYRIRIMQDDRVVWQKENIYRVQISYPSDAPALQAGQRYTWEIETAGCPAVRAWFVIATDAERRDLETERRLLEQSVPASQSLSTNVLLTYGLLASKSFSAEARTIVAAAMASNPDDPLLHFLLGDYYEAAGLNDLAAGEYDEAGFLMDLQK